ncbi:TetR/AcrR family transcriptional regulator [Serpentinicella alkaliphila]|uniref:TetR family transcriptional regulator n=2 Tax=Serpentinicella alkaliphila TaxID=1734049 RepID=A0A4R2THZ2_9FIRM|nr:TetR/AcrR family transcriptional regulator [Serpentinicella alkaliphila]QUH26496.1 TetR/AcrR family transcriptional regulator [Serpentinicella alkaliphila]TCQ03220.1 TetR family transcriptional regulator [Serpentinicella alkaliphila]
MFTRKKILDVSKAIFEENGYKKARASEIAKLANIGEGTLFNYFKSKSELFIATFFESFDASEYKINKTQINSEEQFIEVIISIIDYYVNNIKQIDKQLLREYFSIIYDINSESTIARQNLISADMVIKNNLNVLFNTLLESEINKEAIDFETAIECIYACSINALNEFVYDDEITYDLMLATLRKQIKFIINGNIFFK